MSNEDIDPRVNAAGALTQQRERIQGLPSSVTIKTPAELEGAVEEVKRIKAYLKAVHEYWDDLCQKAHSSWKATTSRRKEFLDPAEALEKTYKLGMNRFHEAERVQKEEEYRKRVEAEEKAAAEKRVAEVEEMRGMGALDEAEHIAAQALDVRPVAAPVETKVKGLSTSDVWHAKVVNLGAFLSFLSVEPRWQYLVKDFPMKELNKLAVAQKEMFDIPGVEAVKEITSSVRS